MQKDFSFAILLAILSFGQFMFVTGFFFLVCIHHSEVVIGIIFIVLVSYLQTVQILQLQEIALVFVT